jgi:hypothetical protein
MKITVTQEDIEQGRKNEPYTCAVARAFLRAGVDHFGVMGERVMVANLGHLVSLLLPRSVRKWILDFDAGKFVVPFTFDIGMPCEQIQIGRNSSSSPAQNAPPSRIIDLNRIVEARNHRSAAVPSSPSRSCWK